MRNLTMMGGWMVLLAVMAVAQGPPTPGPAAKPNKPRVGGPTRGVDTSLLREIERALKMSPEILLAQAKVAQAEAEVMQARLLVTQRVIALHRQKSTLTARLKTAKQRLTHAHGLHRKGLVGPSEVTKEEGLVVQVESELLGLGIEERVLRQGIPGLDVAPGVSKARGPTIGIDAISGRSRATDELHSYLEAKVELNATSMDLAEAIDKAMAATRGTVSTSGAQEGPGARNIRVVYGNTVSNHTVTARISGTRRDALTAIADQCGLAFVIRPYGLLVTTRKQAAGYAAETIPDDIH
ncbi:MAG: hypothetical protein CMJ83_14490 [Planctomycetes bacterium]|nr:hypothetical protein [Planctomycetota bacterium]